MAVASVSIFNNADALILHHNFSFFNSSSSEESVYRFSGSGTTTVPFRRRKRERAFQGLPFPYNIIISRRRRAYIRNSKCFCSINNNNNNDKPDDDGEHNNYDAVRRDDAADSARSESAMPSSNSNNTPASHGPQLDSGARSFEVDAIKLMELLGPEKIDPADVKLIKEKLFGYTTYWVTEEKSFGDLSEGILFLGNLRGNREEVFAKLQRQLKEVVGTKYNLFMIEEPDSEGTGSNGDPRVSFVLLRKEASETRPTSLWQYVIATILFFLTAGSCLELAIASQLQRLPSEVVQYFTNPEATEPPDLQLLIPYVESSLPLAYGVLGVQLFHEVGHFLAALPKKAKLGIPYFIPNITLGSFGAITQFKSVIPDRKTQLDISVAGPVAGGALSFVMFIVGLLLSTSPEVKGELVEVPSPLFQGSLLLGLFSRAALGYKCGLTTTAFNMLPVGCLDGGRAIQAAFGKRALQRFSLATYALLGLGKLGGPLSLPWGLYIVICQRSAEKPCLNDVSDVGSWRKNAVTAAVFLVVLTLLPLWDELAEELGIGLFSSNM